MDYLRALEEGYKYVGYGDESRLVYVSEHVFDFTTYDNEKAELFAIKALEVCCAISNKETFDYIKDEVNYLWYLLMMNTKFFADKTEWGTSIRGAWWWIEDEYPIVLKHCCGLFLDGEQIINLTFTEEEEWLKFIQAVVNFVREDKSVA